MCGFLYIRLKDKDENFINMFESALALMSYRGKDASGVYQMENNYFGHVRLSILDLSPRSNQPVIGKKNILLFTGEIYNYKALVETANSDTLAISELIENNFNFRDKLSGMYALLKFDKQNNIVHVLRDFYGEKPVYYYMDDKIFIVSSTIKAITYILLKKFNKKLKINQISLYEYLLSGYVREPRTIYEEIYMLSSGHELTFSSDWKLKIYNTVNELLDNSILSFKKYAQYSLNTTDVQPALLLSSGVDSTYILNMLAEQSLDFKILTYRSFCHVDESKVAFENASKICKNVNIDFIENSIDIHGLYSEYPHLLEQPSSDGIQLFNILSNARMSNDNKKLKLVFLGTGGDELYGGYNSFKNFNKISILTKLNYLKNLVPSKYKRFFYHLHSKDKEFSYYFLYRICDRILPLAPKEIVEQIYFEFSQEMTKYWSDHFKGQPLYKIKLCESLDYMRNQLLRDSDNISLYCGYEARNPLLSISAYNIKPDNKKSLKAELLKHNIKFNKKRGFTFSDNEYLINFVLQKIYVLNEVYNIFSNKIMHALLNIDHYDQSLVRKLYILFAWFDANKIEQAQLQNFCL